MQDNGKKKKKLIIRTKKKKLNTLLLTFKLNKILIIYAYNQIKSIIRAFDNIIFLKRLLNNQYSLANFYSLCLTICYLSLKRTFLLRCKLIV